MTDSAPKNTSEEDLDGLDETQRAEVHEYEGGGPTDGVILTDMTRDRGEDFVEDDPEEETINLPLDEVGLTEDDEASGAVYEESGEDDA